MSDLTKQRVMRDIGNICSIYPTVGEAFWDEPRERLAGRVAQWSEKLEDAVDFAIDQLDPEMRGSEIVNLREHLIRLRSEVGK